MFGHLRRKLTNRQQDPVTDNRIVESPAAHDEWDTPEGRTLWARMHTANPSLAAEVERGRKRRQAMRDDPSITSDTPQAPEPQDTLHAHEVTPNDAALIRMMAGAHFGDEATVTLPSGRTITGAEMRRWVDTNS